MKILKTIGFIVLALVALMLIIGLFQPTDFKYERDTTINASKEAVFATLNDFKTWEEWGPWQQEDPTMEVTYGEKTVGEGASYNWTSENSGNGTITITESTAPTFLNTALVFDGQEGGNGWFNLEDAESGGTKTSWGMGFEMPYPFNAFSIFTAGKMEKQINDMFDKGLANLKEMVEAQQGEVNYKVQEIDFPGKTYLGIKTTANFETDNMQDFFANSYGQIMGAIEPAKIKMDGHPSGLYFTWDEETKTTEMAAAIPVAGNAAVSGGNIQSFKIPAGKAFVIDYYGPYDGIGAAHYAMDDYLKANGIKAGLPVVEEYVTDPGTEPDDSKWLTKIYYFPEGPIAEEN